MKGRPMKRHARLAPLPCTFLIACGAALLGPTSQAQDAAPADRNAVNTIARPGDMTADSPVTFPKQGALPARYPPDVKERSEPAEKDYYIFSSPCRSVAQIAVIQKEMPPGQFTAPPADWTHLRRTRRILTQGGDLRLLALGDSIVNDTMRSGWIALLQEAYPKVRIMTTPWAEYIRLARVHPHRFYRDVVHANEYGEQILAKILMAFWGPAKDGQARAENAAPGLEPAERWPQRSLNPPVLLPDASEFTTWEAPALRFSRTYHVRASHPRASDDNPGTETRPFATLSRAAHVLQPGERVVVGAGLYRERIRPARGGRSPAQMISYEAEPGAQVILRGSRVFAGPWTRGAGAEARVWSARLEEALFDGYRPFALPNVTEEQFQSMDWAQPQRGKAPFTLARGLVFQDGRRLTQVAEPGALATNAGAYWVDRTNQALHARFFHDADPARALIEVTTQETVFAPDQPGLGFIRIKGFVVEHAAGPFPWEQVGAISTTRGHHWIIEDCTVRQVNGVGLDLGIQHPRWPQPPQTGFHIVRRNVITDCGICGICGLGPGRGRETGLLIEDNAVLRNAWHDAELLWETGGIKTHCNVRCLIRRNLVADTAHGSGIWMDWDNRHSRCCQNIVLGSRTRNGGIFVEASPVVNLVDHNIVWDTTGHGIYEHDSRGQIFAHNLVGRSTGEGFHLHGKITDRRVGGEPMTYGGHFPSCFTPAGRQRRLWRLAGSAVQVPAGRRTW